LQDWSVCRSWHFFYFNTLIKCSKLYVLLEWLISHSSLLRWFDPYFLPLFIIVCWFVVLVEHLIQKLCSGASKCQFEYGAFISFSTLKFNFSWQFHSHNLCTPDCQKWFCSNIYFLFFFPRKKKECTHVWCNSSQMFLLIKHVYIVWGVSTNICWTCTAELVTSVLYLQKGTVLNLHTWKLHRATSEKLFCGPYFLYIIVVLLAIYWNNILQSPTHSMCKPLASRFKPFAGWKS